MALDEQPKPIPNQNPPGESCGDCKFFLDQGDPNIGRCRRDPPTLMFVAVQKPNLEGGMSIVFENASNWPPALKSAWCGEHKPRASIIQ